MPDLAQMGREFKARYPGEYDDLTDADVGKRVKKKSDMDARSAVTSTPMPVVTPMGTLGISPQQTNNALPAAAGMATSAAPLAAGPAAYLAAQARNAIAPMLGDESKMNPVWEGVMQGGPHLLAKGVSAAGKPIAERVMQTALGKFSASGLRAAKEAIAARVGPGFMRMGGAKMIKVVKDQSGKVDAMLEAAKKNGMWHSANDLRDAVDTELLSNPALTQKEHSLIGKWTDEALAGKKDLIDPVTLNKMRSRYDNEASIVRSAREGMKHGKGYVPDTAHLKGRWAKSMADNMRAMLHTVDEAHPNGVPQLAEEQGRLSDMMTARDLTSGIEFKGAKRLLPFAPAAGAGTIGALLPAEDWRQRVLHAGVAGAALSPQGMSNAALTLSDPRVAQLLEGLLRGGAAMADQTRTSP